MTIKTDVELKAAFAGREIKPEVTAPEVPERIKKEAPKPVLRPGGSWAPMADAVDQSVRESQDATKARQNEWAARQIDRGADDERMGGADQVAPARQGFWLRIQAGRRRMKTNKLTLSIDPQHWPWLARHARRLGYAGPKDYAQAIFNMALISELDANDECLPERADADLDPYGDGIPY